jgi:hypothetical protein
VATAANEHALAGARYGARIKGVSMGHPCPACSDAAVVCRSRFWRPTSPVPPKCTHFFFHRYRPRPRLLSPLSCALLSVLGALRTLVSESFDGACVVLLYGDRWWSHFYLRSRLESSVAPVPGRDAARAVAVVPYKRSFSLVSHEENERSASSRRSASPRAASLGGSRLDAAFHSPLPTETSFPIPDTRLGSPGVQQKSR